MNLHDYVYLNLISTICRAILVSREMLSYYYCIAPLKICAFKIHSQDNNLN